MTSPDRQSFYVVTDSTADIPPDTAAELGITVVPLYVQFGDTSFRDGVDITAQEFYKRLVGGPILPRTSQPTPADFASAYRDLVAKGPVLSLHISAKLSGTHNSAVLGRQNVIANTPDAKIEIIDTLQVSMALGLLATEAARKARAGASLEETAAWVNAAIPRLRILIVFDTLEFLAKGGRVGRAQAFLGGLLAVKPLLEVRDGEVHPLERTRTRTRALDRLVQLATEQAPVELAIVAGSTDLAAAEQVAARIKEGLKVKDVPVYQIGAVIGTYAGPGCVGLCILKAGA